MSAFRAVNYTNICYVFAYSRATCFKLWSTYKSVSFSTCRNVNYSSFSEISSEPKNKPSKKTFSSFDSMINQRRNEARRSILVQVQSENSYPELYSYCSQYGTVEEMYHYSLSNELQFILVEFSRAQDVAQIMDVCGHVSQGEIVPVQSPLLWFRVKGAGSHFNSRIKKKSKQIPSNPSLPSIKHGSIVLSNADVMKKLVQATTLSHQMQDLYALSRLDELGSRLRFFTAHQVELALQGLFPNARALPFGSSVNSFGRKGSDLDLCLQLDEHSIERKSGEEGESGKAAIRLVFQTKTTSANGRAQMQRQMETVGDILQLFLPGCTHVRRILQARVPIVKYHQDITGLECDLSMTNFTAVHMSELLWIMGSLDSRVHPLVFFVRHWAKAVGLTNESPGPFITNFTLTLLVIHYLQCCKPHPVLPSLSTLISMAGPEDRRISDDGINCTFLRDISRFPPSENNETLQSLLFGFFEFYSSFDFNGRGLSLAKGHGGKIGAGIAKPDASPLYIENPLERMLNVSKNVNGQELERFKIELRNAAWVMEEMMDHSEDEIELHAEGAKSRNVTHRRSKVEKDRSRGRSSEWGLMALLNSSSSNLRGNSLSVETMMKINARGRLVKVTDLFGEDDLTEDHAKDSNKVQTRSIPATLGGRKR